MRSRRWSAAAVACGAVAPDLPLLLTAGRGCDATHALRAVPTLDVLLGLLRLAARRGLMRSGPVAVLPGRLRARAPAARSHPFGLIPVAVAIGAATHVVRDAFTHAGRIGSVLLAVLQQRVGAQALSSWAPPASAAGGLALHAVAAVVAHRRSVPLPGARRSGPGEPAPSAAAAALAIPVVAAAVAVAPAPGGADPSTSVSALASTAVTVPLPVLAGSSAVVGVFARIRAVRVPRGRGGPQSGA